MPARAVGGSSRNGICFDPLCHKGQSAGSISLAEKSCERNPPFMWQKIKTYLFAHLLGLVFMVIGWALSINFIALDRGSFKFGPGGVTERSLFQTPTFIGLALIIIGAYFPEIWIAIKNRKPKS